MPTAIEKPIKAELQKLFAKYGPVPLKQLDYPAPELRKIEPPQERSFRGEGVPIILDKGKIFAVLVVALFLPHLEKLLNEESSHQSTVLYATTDD
ncbi:MAG: hypothetical protein ACXAB4_06925 [Candidatus Hodarchaeales archaeon]